MEIQIKDGKIFASLKDKWLVLNPEEEVRQKYFARLVNQYGFELDQMTREVQVSNSQRGQGRAMADIVVWKTVKDKHENNSPAIVVECKAEHISVREEDYFQGFNYASWAGADFFVTTNLKETRIFKVVKGKMQKKLEEVIDIPDANTINNSKKVNELLKQTKAFTRDEFSKLLFKCHNIIRNNDKLSPEAAFDEISKILFIKIRYERDNTGAQIFSAEEFRKAKGYDDKFRAETDFPFYQKLFEQTKKDFQDDDLFEPNEVIKIRENSFEAIAEILSWAYLNKTAKFAFQLEYSLKYEDLPNYAYSRSYLNTSRLNIKLFATHQITPIQIVIHNAEGVLAYNGTTVDRNFMSFGVGGKDFSVIPENIIIYYSGLSEILQKLCSPYEKKLSKAYRKGNTNINMDFFYFKPEHFNIILLSLLSFEYADIPEFLKEKAKIQ